MTLITKTITCNKSLVEIPLEELLSCFSQSGFPVNKQCSRRKGRWEDSVAYTLLEKEMMSPYVVCGYELMGERFMVNIEGNVLKILTSNDGSVDRLEEEIKRYG